MTARDPKDWKAVALCLARMEEGQDPSDLIFEFQAVAREEGRRAGLEEAAVMVDEYVDTDPHHWINALAQGIRAAKGTP